MKILERVFGSVCMLSLFLVPVVAIANDESDVCFKERDVMVEKGVSAFLPTGIVTPDRKVTEKNFLLKNYGVPSGYDSEAQGSTIALVGGVKGFKSVEWKSIQSQVDELYKTEQQDYLTTKQNAQNSYKLAVDKKTNKCEDIKQDAIDEEEEKEKELIDALEKISKTSATLQKEIDVLRAAQVAEKLIIPTPVVQKTFITEITEEKLMTPVSEESSQVEIQSVEEIKIEVPVIEKKPGFFTRVFNWVLDLFN